MDRTAPLNGTKGFYLFLQKINALRRPCMATGNEPKGKPESRRKFVKYGAGVVAVAVVAGAAYYLGQSLPTLTSTLTTASVTPTATKSARYGGTLKITIEGEPPGLDPHKATLSIEGWTQSLVYEGLLDIDSEGKFIPNLAETWETPDPKTYIFHLRDSVYFHNGRKVVADDFKYSFERIQDPNTGSPQKVYADIMDKIETPDDKTLNITLKQPYAPMLAQLANPTGGLGFLVVPKEEVEKYSDLQQHMIGTGPFKFVEFRRGDHISFERFENYWRKDPDTGDQLPYLDGIVETFQPDWEVNLANIKTEGTHWLNILNPKDWGEVSVDPDLTAIHPKGMMYFHLHFNHRKKPWNDVRVRRAVAMAINRDEINSVVFFGLGASAANPLGHMPAPYNGITVDVPPYDPEGAKKLLADAGYPDGFDDVLVGCPAPEERKGAEVVAAQLSKIGIRAKVDEPEIGRLLDMFFVKFDYSECVCGGDGAPDPDANFYTVYRPLSSDVTGYNNPDVAAMWQQQEAETDPNKRAKIWTDLLNQALGKDVYIVSLSFRPMFFLYRRYVKGFEWGLDRRNKFYGAWLQK